MSQSTPERRTVTIPGIQDVPGLTFRMYEGEQDIPEMVRVWNESWRADMIDAIATVEEVATDYRHAEHSDPRDDVTLVEMNGELIGSAYYFWNQRRNGLRAYYHIVHLLPQWRLPGLRRALLRYNEECIRRLAKGHPPGVRKVFEVYANYDPNELKGLLESEGYVPGWNLLELVRPELEDVPDLPLPPGIEVRPARPEHERLIWEAAKEALQDERNFTEERWTEKSFAAWQESKLHTPELWQIAWQGNEVVGGVHNFIDRDENERLGRNWGHTETIFVRRPWRRRGIASALIARSLIVLRENGADQATLDMESENPSGALRVYESLGFRLERRFVFYQKPL